MKVRLLFPRSEDDDGYYLESVSIFAARRCRTVKDHDELWEEVVEYSLEKREKFLGQVVFQDWAADILEMLPLVYDWEDIPVWLIVEMLRHRLLWREFSMEQLSQRAIDPMRLKVEAPTQRTQRLVDLYMDTVRQELASGKIPPENLREIIPQGVLVNLVLGGNLRSFHHFFFMRSSPLYGGKGGAHPKFMELADQMQDLAKNVYPMTMAQILKA